MNNSHLKMMFISVLFIILASPVNAQLTGDPFDVNVEIKMLNKQSGKFENRAFKFGLIETEANARAILAEAKKLSGKKLDKFLNDNEVTSIVGINSQGRFKRKVLPGMAIIAVIPMESEGVVIPIKPGKTNLEGTIEYYALESAYGTGKQHEGREILPEPPENDGDSITFTINYKLEAKWAKEDTRVIIQVYMVDCLTDDTVAYCPPVVYEGVDYHQKQNRRMGFEYSVNDSLGKGFNDNRIIVPNTETTIVASVKMRKPDIKRNYKGPYKVSVEDYHHVYFEEWGEGTCLQLEPFKFLDYAPTLGEMELDEEFRTPAESQFGEATKALNLRYDVGKFEYIDDSLNNVRLNEIVEELNSYGKYLIHYDIEGYASPDGTYEKNKELARKRAENAAQAINRRITAKVSKPRISVKVCTWDEVVSELKRRGKKEVAEAIQGFIEKFKNDNAVYQAVKVLPEYLEDVVPVLESQRKMACSIMFRRPHVLNAQEVVAQYFADKKKPQKDRFKFSEGDYFNLLANLDPQKDSADLDTVTIMAYNYCKESKDFLSLKLSPYVANRMAMVKIRRGTPDKSILDPFLDYSISTSDKIKALDEINVIKINRAHHVLNQAVAYYMEEKLDTAKYWLTLIENRPGVPGAIALKHIINLRKNYKKDKLLVNDEEYKRSKNYVLNSSDANRAILYTEIPAWQKRDSAEYYVNLMNDDNPKKWYLKGILWADAGKIKDMEKNQVDDDAELMTTRTFKKLSDEEVSNLPPVKRFIYEEELKKWEEENKDKLQNDEQQDDTINVKGIPNYLAYFQHCFDLDPSFKKYYYNEGHVIPKLRRKYQYKLNKIPAYRKLFRQLKTTDDMAREAALNQKNNQLE